MKIALIRKNYTPYGGAENYLTIVAKRLEAQGKEVHIFSANPVRKLVSSNGANKWGWNASHIHKIRTVEKPSFLSNMLFALNVQRALRKEYFDCILSFERIPFQDIYPVRKPGQGFLSNRVYRAGDGCHKEWLIRRKAVEPFYKRISFSLNPHHFILRYFEKQCLRNSKIIIANSMMVKKDIIRYYRIPEDKIHVIYNGIDLNRFQPVNAEQKATMRSSLGIKENKIVLFVGADFKRKGLTILLNAFSLLDRRDKRLIVIGGKETPQYSRITKRLGIDKSVTFWGPEKEIEKVYAIADVFVLPTIYDPFSNATLEAMASGLPVITTSYNGASELIEDGAEGFVVESPFDAKTFAEKISIVMARSNEMGNRARTKAENYPIDKAVTEIINTISMCRGQVGQ